MDHLIYAFATYKISKQCSSPVTENNQTSLWTDGEFSQPYPPLPTGLVPEPTQSENQVEFDGLEQG